ncbi:MAG: HD domain-containing protein [Candidatus Methanomethylophilaceae archaeon]|nr:HD domain-containing protein [Candidatus Methanomethylophilaceae archaeon]
MSALNAHILYLLFDSANMHRWNDHLRPVDLTEMDKQAHKAAISWVLGKFEEKAGNTVDWPRLIEHQMFSFIQRSVLTDLKPQVFHKIAQDRKEEVNAFVISEYDRLIPDSDESFRERFVEYLEKDCKSREDDIIRAAHYLATRWEFNLIYDSNRSLYGIDITREEIDEQIDQHKDLAGISEITTERSATFNFIDLIGQLRFQQRWARTPRIPKTTVLGHSLMVADSIYLHDLDSKASDRQIYNDYYTALFHDLPEVLTKDVITPIKVNVSGLAAVLEDYERDLVEEKILPLIDKDWHEEFRFMVLDPFTDVEDGKFGTRNGYDIKTCDNLAAYMEAHISICYGVSSSTLRDGEHDIRVKLLGRKKGIDTAKIISDLDTMHI